VIRQGDLFWVDLGEPSGSGPGLRRPFVVVQNDLFNRSRLATVIMCALTSNLRRAAAPGNVLLAQDEGNLSQDSVVNVTQLFTIDKGELTDRIGRLGNDRVADILRGIRLVLDPRRTPGQPEPLR
jgi:mRNA interferase MazF